MRLRVATTQTNNTSSLRKKLLFYIENKLLFYIENYHHRN